MKKYVHIIITQWCSLASVINCINSNKCRQVAMLDLTLMNVVAMMNSGSNGVKLARYPHIYHRLRNSCLQFHYH